jgi:ATP-dependent Lhr-like helicase
VWRADGAKDPRAARLSFFFRGEGAVFLPAAPPDLSALSPAARELYEKLALAGASFLSDLRVPGVSGDSGQKTERALVELILAGLVTGDGIGGFREILRKGRRASARSSDAREARETASRSSPVRRPGRAALRAAESRVSARLGRSPASSVLSGRWSLLSSPGVLGEPLRADERAEAWARLLLARWGVVSRDVLLAEDPSCVRWTDVAPVLARLELRGDLRRGEFVEGSGPLQYAEEETVEALRAARESAGRQEPALAIASGSDPALFGLPGPAGRDTWTALADGRLLFRLGADGDLVTGADTTDRLLKHSISALQDVRRRGRDPLGRPRRLVVARVNGRAAASSALATMLEAAGFSRDAGSYAWRAL